MVGRLYTHHGTQVVHTREATYPPPWYTHPLTTLVYPPSHHPRVYTVLSPPGIHRSLTTRVYLTDVPTLGIPHGCTPPGYTPWCTINTRVYNRVHHQHPGIHTDVHHPGIHTDVHHPGIPKVVYQHPGIPKVVYQHPGYTSGCINRVMPPSIPRWCIYRVMPPSIPRWYIPGLCLSDIQVVYIPRLCLP